MRVSDRGILEICEHEGIVPAPYYDSVGVLTFGVGHTAAAGGVNPADMPFGMPDDMDAGIDYALAVFQNDLKKYEARVNDALKVPVAQHEFDALVSFDFNTGGIYRARLTKTINANEHDAARHFMGWLKPPEIRKRRTAEMRLFETGDYDANGTRIPIWRVNGQGKLSGMHSTVEGQEILRRMERGHPTPGPALPSGGLLAAILRALRAIFGKAST